MPNYKNGKIVEQLSFQEIQHRVNRAMKKVTREGLAFFWLLYYAGCRKSEAYERTVDDCQLTATHFIIDFHQRKKHGATVPALKLPLTFPGIETLKAQLLKARESRTSRKRLYYQAETDQPALYRKTGKPILRKDGSQKLRTETASKIVRAHWLFPHIQARWAQTIVKNILGENYYPHFLRLNRITELASDPTMNLTRMKSYTGIKSLDALQSYMGSIEKEQDAAIDFMAKQIKPNKQKNTRR
jgi:hypothetical protein